MNRRKINIKEIFIISMISIIFFFNKVNSYAEELPIVARNAIAMEASSGKILYEKNSKEKMYPASTTKLWTAYLVIKNTDNLDKKIIVESDLSWVEPTSMYLKEGETFTIRELLEVLLLKSANDVAVLLAIETSGSVEEFSKLMNEEAKAIGCNNTNFLNPNGLHDENHYSTAYDMALMARECLKNKDLMEIVKKDKITIKANEFYPYDRVYKNSNKFISGEGQFQYDDELIDYKYDIVNGLKTGYTSVAGRCLMTSSELNGTQIITGVFNSIRENVYVDSRRLIDYSFENFETTNIVKANELNSKLIVKSPLSKKGEIKGYINEEYVILNDKNNENNLKNEEYTYEINMNRFISPWVKKDEVIGKVEVYKNKEKVKEVEIYASENSQAIFDKEQLLLLTIGISGAVIISIRKHNRKRLNKKRREENIYLNNR